MRDTRLVPSVFHFPSHHMTSGGYAKRVSPSAHARTLAYHTRSRSKWHLPHLTLDWIPPRSRSTCRACMRDTRLVPSVFHFPSHHMTSGGYTQTCQPLCTRPHTRLPHAIPLEMAPPTLNARLDPAVLAGRACVTPGLSQACFTSPATT